MLVVNVGSLEKRSSQPKYEEPRTRSQVIPFTLQVKHAPSLHTLPVTVKT